MDESLQELENELLNLRPRRTSPALQARVAAELALPEGGVSAAPRAGIGAAPLRRRGWLSWQFAAGAAVASLAASAVWLAPTFLNPRTKPVPVRTGTESVARPVPPPPTAGASAAGFYRPVGAASVLYDLKDDGEIYRGDNPPLRRVRYRYVDTYTWRNRATNASLKWSVPREEIRVLPASLH